MEQGDKSQDLLQVPGGSCACVLYESKVVLYTPYAILIICIVRRSDQIARNNFRLVCCHVEEVPSCMIYSWSCMLTLYTV